MKNKLRRPGETAPMVMSDRELEEALARPDQLERRRREHLRWVQRLGREPDPGEKGRDAHLRKIETHLNEAERLSSALAATSVKAQDERHCPKKEERDPRAGDTGKDRRWGAR